MNDRVVKSACLVLFFFLFSSAALALSSPKSVTTWDGGSNCQNLSLMNTPYQNSVNLTLPTNISFDTATINISGGGSSSYGTAYNFNISKGENATYAACGGDCAGYADPTIVGSGNENDGNWNNYVIFYAGASWAKYFYIDFKLNNSIYYSNIKLVVKANSTGAAPGMTEMLAECGAGYSISAGAVVISSPTASNTTLPFTGYIPSTCVQGGNLRLRITIFDIFSTNPVFGLWEMELQGQGQHIIQTYPARLNLTLNGTHREYTNTTTFDGYASIALNQTFLQEFYGTGTKLNFLFQSNQSGTLNVCIQNITYRQDLVRMGDVTYYGRVVQVNGTNYTRFLNYTFNTTCSVGESVNLDFFLGGAWKKTEALTCTGVVTNTTGWTLATTEGNKTLSILLNDSTDPGYNVYKGNDTFFWDLYAPVATFNYSIPVGFSVMNGTFNLTCNDSAYSPLFYNVTIKGVVQYAANLTNSTLLTLTWPMVAGTTNSTGSCSDLFDTTTLSKTFNVYMHNITIIDEKTGLAFDVQNVSSCKIYLDDNSSYYDFKATNTTVINFSSGTNTKLRLEIGYLTGDIVMRYIDISLNDSEPLRLCANKEGITHYENILTSSSERGVALKNVFANCLVALDYTRFAYQDNKILKTFTIPGTYYLYLYSDPNTRTLLASVDGSIATWIQIDVIEFSQTRTSVSGGGEALTFQRTGATTIRVYYHNGNNDAVSTDLTITRMDTSTDVYTTTETSTPNEITYYFDYSTLSNVTNTTLFRATVTRTDGEGNEKTLKRYFDIHGKTGTLMGQVGFVIALLLTIFGLTLTATRYTFGWFGIIICIASIAILASSVQLWYVIFLESVNVIIMMFIGIMMWKNNTIQVT